MQQTTCCRDTDDASARSHHRSEWQSHRARVRDGIKLAFAFRVYRRLIPLCVRFFIPAFVSGAGCCVWVFAFCIIILHEGVFYFVQLVRRCGCSDAFYAMIPILCILLLPYIQSLVSFCDSILISVGYFFPLLSLLFGKPRAHLFAYSNFYCCHICLFSLFSLAISSFAFKFFKMKQ